MLSETISTEEHRRQALELYEGDQRWCDYRHYDLLSNASSKTATRNNAVPTDPSQGKGCKHIRECQRHLRPS